MAGLFKRIGDSIKSALGMNPEAMDKLDMLSDIENLLATVAQVQMAFNPSLMAVAFPREGIAANPNLSKILKAYEASLGTAATGLERWAPMRSYLMALGVVHLDLKNLYENFDKLFGAPKTADVKMEDLHISDAVVLGYIHNTTQLVRWGSYILAIATANGEAIPPYQLAWTLSHASSVAEFVNSLVSRPSHSDLVTRLLTLRRSGKDAALSTNGATLDQYASENDFDGATMSSMKGFIPSLGLMVGKYRIERQRAQMEELKHIQNWLRNKISLLQLDLAKKDPNSPEYRKIKAYTENYMRDLTATDKKLATYEGV